MEVDQHLIWVLGALKASISDNNVDEKKLNKSISDCLSRVKHFYTGVNKEQNFEEFKVKCTLVLVLCCPVVRDLPAVQNSKDFQAVILSFPVLPESVVFSVIRNQKLYKFIMPVMSCLPLATLRELIQEYFTCTNEVTPVTLAITLELLKAILCSVQNISAESCVKEEISDIVKLFLKFHSLKKVSNGSSAQVKSSAYFFMYLCECTFIMLSSYSGKCIEQQRSYQASKTWTDLWKGKGDVTISKAIPISPDILRSFLQMCQENVKAVTVDLWMEWNDVALPASVTVHRKPVTVQTKPHENTIQSVICNIAFDTLKIVEANGSVKDILTSSDCKDLTEFFKQVAADPDYDADVDLSTDQLLSEINLKDERYEKLLGILLERNDIFSSEKCLDSMALHSDAVNNNIRQQILVRLIKHIKDGRESNNRLIEVVLNMAERLSTEQLLQVIENHLSLGQDEILKTPEFNKQMTAIFNQLADSNSVMNSSKHVWLCLQSAQAVVYEAVRLPVAFPGLVNVMVQALTAIPQVCRAKGKTGNSVLVNILQERQLAGLHGREQKDFAALVKGLIKADIADNLEVLHLLVQPCLKISSEKELENLDLSLELLQSIVEHDVKAVVKPSAELVSLIITLAYIIHFTSHLNSHSFSINLKLRADAFHILRSINQVLLNDPGSFERDISMLKQVIAGYNLHPRSMLPLKELLSCKEESETCEDCLLLMLSKLQMKQQGRKSLQFNCALNFPKKLKEASREEWIIALLQLMPHSSEEEWLIAFYITHQYLQAGHMAIHTMLIFKEVLYLACTKVKGLSKTSDIADEEACHIPSISLQHCFKCFANAAMVYLEELMKDLPYLKRFKSLCTIFRWWCRIVPIYHSMEELPTLLLMQLTSAMEEMFNAEDLLISEVGTSLKPNTNDASRNDYTKKNVQDDVKKIDGTQQVDISVSSKVTNGEEQDSREVDKKNVVVEKMSGLQINQDKSLDLQNGGSNNNTGMSNFEGKISSRSSVSERNNRTRASDTISRADFEKEIGQTVLFFMKYVPSSNLASSIAGKLKKLYES